METKKAQMTRRMRDYAKTVVEMFKSDSEMSISQSIDEFSEHCKDVAGEQFSKFDAKRIDEIGKSFKHNRKITIAAVLTSATLAIILALTVFMFTSIDQGAVKKHKQMQRDLNTMKLLWTYQFRADSVLLWNLGLNPYLEPMDTNLVKENTLPIDWAIETMKAAKR